MKKILLFTILLLTVACTSVPISNRKQISIVPNSTLIEESKQSYNEIIKKSTILNDSKAKEIKTVGANMQKAVEAYMTSVNKSSLISNFAWEFNLIKDDSVNAWCMPGGKVAFYTGILPYTLDETGIATVMGHEIAHAIANHGNERLSQSVLLNFGYSVLEEFKNENPTKFREVLYQSFGIGSTLGSLKFSRVQELEADKLGLIFMAMAGYDPSKSVDFWNRMSKSGSANIEILSTHPNDAKRISKIKAFLPEALKYYKK